MRAAVIEATGDPGALHEASVPVPSPVLSELLVRVVAAGVNPIDAKTRAGSGVSAAIAVVPGGARLRLQRHRRARRPYESHPLPAGHRRCSAWPPSRAPAARTPSTRSCRRSRSRASRHRCRTSRRPGFRSRLSPRGDSSSRPRTRTRASGSSSTPAAAASATSRCSSPRTSARTSPSPRRGATRRGCANSAPRSSSTTRRRGSRTSSPTSTSSSTSSATSDDRHRHALAAACCAPAGCTSSCRPASWPGYADAAAAAGVRATSYKVIPDGGALATVARLLDSGAVQVYIDKVFDLRDAADAHAELEKGHTRGKIVLRVSDD